jgi:hypothetical protein
MVAGPMVAFALSLLLAADASGADAELKLAAPGLSVTGLDSTVAEPLTDHLAKAFAPVRVITARDISVLLGLERQKQLLGCAESSDSCMAELGNALGAQGVLLGDIVKLGNVIQINLRVIDPVNGRVLASASTRVESDGAIFDALTTLGQQTRAQFIAVWRERSGVHASRGTRRFALIPFVVAGGAALAGIICLAFSESAWQQVTNGSPGSLTLGAAQRISSGGKDLQTAGAVLLSVAAVAAIAGAGVLFFGRPDETSAALTVAPNGLALAGSF